MVDKFLVIGSNSFSGSHFVRYLLDVGYQVFGVSRSLEPDKVFLPYKWEHKNSKNFNFEQIDLNKDTNKLLDIVKENKVNYIVNFASQGMVAESWNSPEDWYKTNVLSQVKLHDELRKIIHLEKYIHISTPEVYGSTNNWIKENYNFSPSTPYAVSRAACDLHLKSFFDAYKFPVIYTRAANVYGPGQQIYRIVPRTILATKSSPKLELHGGGSSKRSFIHINDVVKATLKIALNGRIGETYHISTKKPISIRKLVEKICSISSTNFKDVVNITDERLAKDDAYLLDSSKIRKELDWQDDESLEDGILETMSWINSNITKLQNLPLTYEHRL